MNCVKTSSLELDNSALDLAQMNSIYYKEPKEETLTNFKSPPKKNKTQKGNNPNIIFLVQTVERRKLSCPPAPQYIGDKKVVEIQDKVNSTRSRNHVADLLKSQDSK